MISYEEAVKKIDETKQEEIELREKRNELVIRRKDLAVQLKDAGKRGDRKAKIKIRQKIREIVRDRKNVQFKLDELSEARSEYRQVVHQHKINMRLEKMPKYKQLLNLLDEAKPKTIVEIGTWAGKTAVDMCIRALSYNDEVHYIGYDIFDLGDKALNEKELNVKRPASKEEVEKNLETVKNDFPGFTYELIAGDTNETLQEHKVDFVFVDGGHSIETIRNDYEHVKESKMIVFDDYYILDNEMRIPDLKLYGANKIIQDHPNLEILPPVEDNDVDHTLNTETGGIAVIAVIRNYDES